MLRTFYLVYVIYDEEIAMVATEVGQKLENTDQSIFSKYWLNVRRRGVLGAGVIKMNKVSNLPCPPWTHYQTDK